MRRGLILILICSLLSCKKADEKDTGGSKSPPTSYGTPISVDNKYFVAPYGGAFGKNRILTVGSITDTLTKTHKGCFMVVVNTKGEVIAKEIFPEYTKLLTPDIDDQGGYVFLAEQNLDQEIVTMSSAGFVTARLKLNKEELAPMVQLPSTALEKIEMYETGAYKNDYLVRGKIITTNIGNYYFLVRIDKTGAIKAIHWNQGNIYNAFGTLSNGRIAAMIRSGTKRYIIIMDDNLNEVAETINTNLGYFITSETHPIFYTGYGNLTKWTENGEFIDSVTWIIERTSFKFASVTNDGGVIAKMDSREQYHLVKINASNLYIEWERIGVDSPFGRIYYIWQLPSGKYIGIAQLGAALRFFELNETGE